MPIDETKTLAIVCDNPACPGNDLPVDDRTGWLFVSHEVYGKPTLSNVYCSPTCVAVAAPEPTPIGMTRPPEPDPIAVEPPDVEQPIAEPAA